MTPLPLLIEIGCEEIPPRMVPAAARQLRERVTELLDRAGLAHGKSIAWGGPRRLAVRVESVQPRQDDREEQVVGPPAAAAFGKDGSPTRAAEGFARKHGVPVAELLRVNTKRGAYAGFVRRIAGKGTGEILAEALPAAVEGMYFPKTMRWGDGRHRWVRPVHWVVALLGPETIPVEIFGVRAGSHSRGHRFLSEGPVAVEHPDRYVDALRRAWVLVDPAERRRTIVQAAESMARQTGGRLVPDGELLEHVADLAEWPGVIRGSFDSRYLVLPREVLRTTLRHHQKCFSIQSDGKLLPAFLAVANTHRDPGGHIRRGNEWVVAGRLEDARFFWDADRRRSLEEHASELARVVFHARLGSFAEKAVRMRRLAGGISEMLALDAHTRAAAESAAALAKADLVTQLVGEFPELQGVAGGLMLRAEGAPEAVADAVYEHYRPTGAEDEPPATAAGMVVSLADRLDTLTGCFAAGLAPTGSRDPLALRRAATGMMRIVLERELDAFDTSRALALARDEWRGFDSLERRCEDLSAFLRERLAFLLEKEGHRYDTVAAVLAAGADVPWDAALRCRALETARRETRFADLAIFHKRIRKILEQAEGRGEAPGPVKADLLRESAEEALYREFLAVRDVAREACDRREYPEALDRIAALRNPVNRFFDEVMVLSGGPEQTNRLGLLAEISRLFSSVADFARIVVDEGERGRSGGG